MTAERAAAARPRRAAAGPLRRAASGLRPSPRAGFRAIRWALPRGHRPYPTRGGRVYLDASESVMMLMRVLRRYEPAKHRALARMLGPGMTFVDIGACKGDFTVLASALVGAKGRVVAAEPEPVNASWLRKTVALATTHNVDVCELALGAERGRAILHRVDVGAGPDTSSGLHSVLPGAVATHDRVDVAAETLDGLLATMDIDRVDVIKIDVEG
ncbi:MAG: FkbM family methyltransferase, partial [Actinobacteria bacterium]|nr:FkbM family methyltransferase [Actinomycetota bacterium]